MTQLDSSRQRQLCAAPYGIRLVGWPSGITNGRDPHGRCHPVQAWRMSKFWDAFAAHYEVLCVHGIFRCPLAWMASEAHYHSTFQWCMHTVNPTDDCVSSEPSSVSFVLKIVCPTSYFLNYICDRFRCCLDNMFDLAMFNQKFLPRMIPWSSVRCRSLQITCF